MSTTICIVGAGNIGSRHLQALKKVSQKLCIYVIDPSSNSLDLAKKRYTDISFKNKHEVSYSTDFKELPTSIDIAILSTNSNTRCLATQTLFKKSSVKYIIFEKLLFNKKDQYEEIHDLLLKNNCKAWVNCSMRTDPFYVKLKTGLSKPFTYIVDGSLHGLATNAIHYIDHMAYLSGCYDFKIETSLLHAIPVESKRKGFLELMGTLKVCFADGSLGSFTCYPTGNSPFMIEILSDKYRILIDVFGNNSLIATPQTKWRWVLKNTPLLYQSQMTNSVVSSLVKSGSCLLTPFDISAKMHLTLLDSLVQFLNKQSKQKYNDYPFT